MLQNLQENSGLFLFTKKCSASKNTVAICNQVFNRICDHSDPFFKGCFSRACEYGVPAFSYNADYFCICSEKICESLILITFPLASRAEPKATNTEVSKESSSARSKNSSSLSSAPANHPHVMHSERIKLFCNPEFIFNC